MGKTNYRLLKDNIEYLCYLGHIKRYLRQDKNVYILRKIINSTTLKLSVSNHQKIP